MGESSCSGLAVDEVAGLRDVERVPHLFVGGVLVAEAHVAGDGAREQERLLRHEPDEPLEQRLVELAHVDATDQHLTGGDVEQSCDHVEQGGLARSRCCR